MAGWKPGDKIAAVALLVSALSLIVSGFSAYWAWNATQISPLLSFTLHEHNEGSRGVGLYVENAGKSPILISKMEIFYDGMAQGSWDNFTQRIKQEGITPTGNPIVNFYNPSSPIPSESKEIPLYTIRKEFLTTQQFDRFIRILHEKLAVRISFCSESGTCTVRCAPRSNCP